MLRLTPKPSARPLDLKAFRLLAEEEFSEVCIDRDEGESQKAVHLHTLQRLGAPRELVARRNALEAAIVTVADSQTGDLGYVSFLYFPGEEIIIGFSGPTHEEQGTPVGIKLAAALGYDVSYK